MLRRKNIQIQVGDRFTKADDKNAKAWEVVYLWTAVDGIPHARLAQVGKPADLRTLAVAVLNDPQFWTPVIAAR